LIINPQSLLAQWQFAESFGGAQSDGSNCYFDNNNNIYCAGVFNNNLIFNNDTLNANGSNDLFLAKFSPAGVPLWLKQFGGYNSAPNSETISNISFDNNFGQLYVSGIFYNNLIIDADTLFGSGPGLFLAKFDVSGNCQWLIKAHSSFGVDFGRIDFADNYVYWTGELKSNGFVDSFSIDKGLFLAKIDTGGNTLWARNQMNGARITSIEVLNGNVYYTGWTNNDTLIVDTLTFIANLYSLFLVKTDTAGMLSWARLIKGWNYNFVLGMELESSIDNLYIVGQFEDSLFMENDTLVSSGLKDYFIIRLDSNGAVIWAKQGNTTGNSVASARSIRIDAHEQFYVVGEFGGTSDFGAQVITSYTNEDIFLARFDTAGSCTAVEHFGQASSSNVDVDSNGDVLICGNFMNNLVIGGNSLTSHGSWDIFIAKHDAFVGQEEERSANYRLHIYANPTTGKCNITVPDDLANERYLELGIYDNTGRVLQQKVLEMNDGTIKVNLEAEAKGVYQVTLGNEKKRYSGTIVFE
jgi:hypothetical protein